MLESIRSMKIGVKLGLVFAAMGLPIVTLLVLFLQARNVQISQLQSEIEGLEYLVPLRGLLEHVSQHQALTLTVQSGDASVAGRVERLLPLIDREIAALEAVDQRFGRRQATGEHVKQIKNEWLNLRQSVNKLSAEENLEKHNRLLGDITELFAVVGEQSLLILDAQLDTYYVGESVLARLPHIAEKLGRLRYIVSTAQARGMRALSGEERLQVQVLVDSVEEGVAGLRRALNGSYSKDPSLESKVNPAMVAAVGQIDSFVRPLRDRSGDLFANTTKKAIDVASAPIGGVLALWDTLLPNLKSSLEARQARLGQERLLQLAAVVLVLLLATGLVIYINRGITRQVKAINDTFTQVASGNYDVRSQVLNFDELGSTAESLNNMLDKTVTLIQSTEDRNRIQRSIQKLLEDISGLAEGDLTREAEVTADVTGAIADSFNYLIGELRQIISNVQQTTVQVGASASRIVGTAETLAKGSQQQARQINQATAAIQEMTVSIQQVSANAGQAASVAGQALHKAKLGAESVLKTMQGMNGIRNQVQETAKRLKSLGERSQEIGEIVRLIGDLADRTSILALNASIQAATAGEAGRGFAVVAGEVEQLAERAADATKKCDTLIKAIQVDTSEAIAAMEDTTKEVVSGNNLANAAGQTLGEIESVSNQLADLIKTISSVAETQARGSAAISRSMHEISVVTKQTADGAQEAASSVQELARLADELNGSLRKFRLPQGLEWEPSSLIAH